MGATSHIINEQSEFVKFDSSFNVKDHVIELAHGSKANVVFGRGNTKVKSYDINGNLHDVILDNALYIPSNNHNIFCFCSGRKRQKCESQQEGKIL